MELKEKLLSSYVAFENRVDINSDIHEIRSKALQNFEDLGFPTKKARSLEIHFFKLYFKTRL
jgi:Fe-S cluster assembly protein SufD